MSHILNLRESLAYVLVCSLFVTGFITPRQSHASNNSLRHSSTPSVNESSDKTAPPAKTVGEATRSRDSEAHGKLPLSFEENRGQVDKKVKYISRGAGYALFLTPTEAVLALSRSEGKQATPKADARRSPIPAQPRRERASVVRMKLNGANRSLAVRGESETGMRTSYSKGNDPAKWQTDIAHYERVRYEQVYPGVDMIYYGEQQQLEYDFEIAPGADARQIALEFDGVKRVRVEQGTGDLVFEKGGEDARPRKPVAYQEVGGERREVASRYVAKSKKRVRIEVGEYDRARPLVINSVLSYLTPLNGNSQDSNTTASSDSRTPNQYRKDQPVTKPADSGFYSISGSVADSDGIGIEGILMVLDAPESSITYTDQDGYYSFDNLQGGSDYTVYPSEDNSTFDPEQYDFFDLESNGEVNFTRLSVSYSISGSVYRSDLDPIKYVTINLNGDLDNQSTTVDYYDGYFSFENVPGGGSYTVSAYREDVLTWVPEEHYISDLQSDEYVNFYTPPVTLSGTIKNTANGAGLAGVTVNLSAGGSVTAHFDDRYVTTGSDGSYSFPGVPVPMSVPLWIIPRQNNFWFSPHEWRDFVYADVKGINFNARRKVYSISGVVKYGDNALAGVTVKLTSPNWPGFTPRTTTTTSTGAYSFNNVQAARNYVVTPQKTGYRFTPPNRSFANLSANHTTVNFLVKVYSISGRVTRTGTTTGISAVTMTLTSPTPTGFPARTAQTYASGNYYFYNVPAGRDYTIKPSKSGLTFSPATRSITNLSGNIPAGASTSFTGTGP